MHVLPENQTTETMANIAVSASLFSGRPIFSVRELSKSFGPVEALKQVSLDVYPGEIRAVCGENGAGKSTLVNILAGLIGLTQGRSVLTARSARCHHQPKPNVWALPWWRKS